MRRALAALALGLWSAPAVADTILDLGAEDICVRAFLTAEHPTVEFWPLHTIALRVEADGTGVLVSGQLFDADLPVVVTAVRLQAREGDFRPGAVMTLGDTRLVVQADGSYHGVLDEGKLDRGQRVFVTVYADGLRCAPHIEAIRSTETLPAVLRRLFDERALEIGLPESQP